MSDNGKFTRNYNHVALEGNLTRDPVDVRDGKGVMFTLAVNDDYVKKDGDVVNRPYFFSVAVYNANSVTVRRLAKKGSHVLVEGKLTTYPDKNSGETKTAVNAFFVRLLR